MATNIVKLQMAEQMAWDELFRRLTFYADLLDAHPDPGTTAQALARLVEAANKFAEVHEALRVATME